VITKTSPPFSGVKGFVIMRTRRKGMATDDFGGDYERMRAAGVRFTQAPRHEPYGTVAVFADRWDLIQPS
jgi:hypothetical protein